MNFHRVANKAVLDKLLFKEVGMAVPKSTQTRVGMIEINQVRRSSLFSLPHYQGYQAFFQFSFYLHYHATKATLW